MTAIVAALTVVVALLTVLVAGLLRSHAEILRRLHELGAGLDVDSGSAPAASISLTAPPARSSADVRPVTHAPDIVGHDAAGDALSIAVSGRPHRTLLAFLSGGCTTCAPFWQAFGRPEALGLPADLRAVIVTRGNDAESPSRIADLAGTGTVVMSTPAWSDFAVPGAPYFVLVTDDRVTGEGTGVSWEQVRRLLGEATGDDALASDRTPSDVDLTGPPAARDEREGRIDRALLSAGIRPGDESLYHPAGGSAPGGGE